MAGNGFGTLFRFTTWGESHGPAIGCVVEGVPPRLKLSEADIQPWLDKRRPGTSRFTTQRQESDRVQIMSGVFEGQTTGAPLLLFIANEDARAKDYDAIKDSFRPGHADYTYWAKYNTASATIAAAAAPRHARPRPASRRARWRARSSATG